MHAEVWGGWRDEATTRRYNPVGPATLEELKRRLVGWDGRLTDQGRDEYRYIVLADDRPVGTAAVMNVSWRQGYAEIGYLVGEAHQRRGIGRAAVATLVQLVFSQSPLRRLQALVSVENEASQRILDSLGFVREGRLRAHFIVEGRPVDEIVFGLLREEWQAQRAAP
jgi:RimJ/RimL family protein N-acetyltransferase